MKIKTLQDLYVEQLHDLYSAETQLVDALPKMAKAATNVQLKTAFTEHLAQTQVHVQRLEQIFTQLGEKTKGPTCKGMQGLIAEGEEMIKTKGDPAAIDAGLIAQRSGLSTTRWQGMAVYAPMPSNSVTRRVSNCSSRRSTRRARPTIS